MSRVGNRLAGYDENGDELFDRDVLSDEELAEDAEQQAVAQGGRR